MPRKSEQIPREEKKKEALRLMQIMGFDKRIIANLKDKNSVVLTSRAVDLDMDDVYNKKLSPKLKEFLIEHHAFVYAVTRNYTEYGVIDSLLFVSDYKEDWKCNRNNARDMIPMAYCINHTHPQFSEFGSVSIFLDSSGTPSRRF